MALLSCKTVREAAEQSGVSVSTVMRWQREPDFRAALQAAQDEVLRHVTRRLIINSADAVEGLADIAGDPDAPAGARVQAMTSTVKLGREGHTLENLEERITRLEQQSNETD